MILQSSQAPFPPRGDRVLFVSGLLAYMLGQVLLNFGQDFVDRQRPIDFAHWSLLIGVLLMLPFAGQLPRRNIHWLTQPLLIAGIAAIIGMCLIDFVFWSLPGGDFEYQLFLQLREEPSIWQAFIIIGPNYVFGAGLALPSLSYWNASRTGTLLVLAGTAMNALLNRDWIVQSYLLITLGYALNFGLLNLVRTGLTRRD